KKCLSLNGLPMNTRNLLHITGRIWWHWCNQPTSWLKSNCMNLSKAQPEKIVPLITIFSVDILHANSAEARQQAENYFFREATGVSISRWIMRIMFDHSSPSLKNYS
ncbi:hypothetical protein ACJX0J_041925, partial [Zea mays]